MACTPGLGDLSPAFDTDMPCSAWMQDPDVSLMRDLDCTPFYYSRWGCKEQHLMLIVSRREGMMERVT